MLRCGRLVARRVRGVAVMVVVVVVLLLLLALCYVLRVKGNVAVLREVCP